VAFATITCFGCPTNETIGERANPNGLYSSRVDDARWRGLSDGGIARRAFSCAARCDPPGVLGSLASPARGGASLRIGEFFLPRQFFWWVSKFAFWARSIERSIAFNLEFPVPADSADEPTIAPALTHLTANGVARLCAADRGQAVRYSRRQGQLNGVWRVGRLRTIPHLGANTRGLDERVGEAWQVDQVGSSYLYHRCILRRLP
jgi:hypothetical protein